MPAILPSSFFNRPAEVVAQDLLGKTIVRRRGRERKTLIITETEAYIGPQDRASHAARGRTARTEVMFGPPGTLYIYLVYGLHWMLNVVTREKGYPAAVLIRCAHGVEGPGRVARVLGIHPCLNGKMASRASGLWFEDAEGKTVDAIKAAPRIGVSYAGPYWSARRLRFMLQIKGESDSMS